MVEANIESMIFERDDEGALIGETVRLSSISGEPEVTIVPLNRGQLKKCYNKSTSSDPEESAQADSDIIKYGLVKPKLTDKQIEDLKPEWIAAISTSIIAVSTGVSEEEIKIKSLEVLKEKEEELKKN